MSDIEGTSLVFECNQRQISIVGPITFDCNSILFLADN